MSFHTSLPILAAFLMGSSSPSADTSVAFPETGAFPSAAGPACALSTAAPIRIEMTPTRRAGGARAVYEMRFTPSAFGIAVSGDGHYRYHVEVSTQRLPTRSGRTFVTWVAKPDLDEWINLGAIEDGQPVSGEVGWNQFIVFVTAEASADPESWSQEFYFSALSPSSRMHTMMGHGPFASEPCLDPRN